MPDQQPAGVLIVTVTKVEAQAILDTFSKAAGKKWARWHIGNKTYYDLGIHGDVPVSMVQSEMGTATPSGSLSTAHQAIRDLQPQAIIMCGIAFGLHPKKQQLGDILVSKQILYYEPQKIDLQKGQMPRGDRVTVSDRLLDRFRSGDNDWQGAQTHFGLVVSGEKLVNDPDFRDWLLQTEPEAVGGEMEGEGLYAAARETKVDWILVKGICDWADGNKNDDAQTLAALNAAQFVLHVLDQGGWDKVGQSESPLASMAQIPETGAKARLLIGLEQGKLPTVTYTVFISSPGDVIKERETANKIINEINKRFRTISDLIGTRIILDSLTWEKDVFPNTGAPQDTIKKQIPYERCDIFIGIFWRRFGTPPGTVRSQDGRPYLSGTEQEIEEAMAHQEKEGSPVIMLYRKDEPASGQQSDEEVEQHRMVTDFFRECETRGKHPALVMEFRDEAFGEMLRDHLFKVVNNLRQSAHNKKNHKSPQDTSLTKPKRQRDDLAPQFSDEMTENLDEWLKGVKLREHPFPSLYAEYDPELSKYFARFQQIRALTKAEVFQDRNPWIFVGDLGTGKTALRKLLASWGNPDNSRSDILCLEFGREDIQGILSEVDRLDDFASRFLQVVHHKIVERQQNYGLCTPNWQPKGDLAGSLASLSQAVQDCGLMRVMCLVDPDDESFELRGVNIVPKDLIEKLFRLRSAPGGIGFCYFLPSEVTNQLKVLSNPPRRFRIIQIQWTIEDLLGLISRRMTTCSSNQLSPYSSLGQICDDERDLASLVDRKIATLAEGSPRAVISLANHLIELHVQDAPQQPQITPKTWDEVEMDWWWQRRNTILGILGHSLWARDEHVFFGNRRLALTDTTSRLLSCLVRGPERFAVKDELKQAGWPEASSQGVSDPALREAVRRMKNELKAEFKTNNLGDPPTVKSVHGRGYRLENVKPSDTGGDNGGE